MEILVEGQVLYQFQHKVFADRSIMGSFRQPSNTRMSTPESHEALELSSTAMVRIDPRVIKEVDRKKPIGVTRTGWVNLLLQRAIASEPEPLTRD